MEEQAKKKVHITWEEAVRAEAEQDKARQARCRPIPPSQLKLGTTLFVPGHAPKLKASALRLWDVASNRRLRTTTETAGAHSRISEIRHEDPPVESQRGRFGPLAVGVREESRQFDIKRGPTKSAIAIFLGMVLAAGVGTVSYLSVNRGAVTQQHPGHTSEPELTVGGSKAQSTAPQIASTKPEPVRPEGQEIVAKNEPSYLGDFDVVDNSFVRDKPESNAIIIATLQPGTRVRVESKSGEYLHVRSLNDAQVDGYVHEEDAFFQAH